MNLNKGQRMSQYKKTRIELGTVKYSKIITPNLLHDFTLYTNDLNDMIEIEKNQELLQEEVATKTIDLQKKNTLFDLLEITNNKSENKKTDKKEDKKENNKEDNKKEENKEENKKEDNKKEDEKEDKKEDNKEDNKGASKGKKKLKITVSTEPDSKSNRLIL